MRKSGIESFRLIAMIGVVIIHVYPINELHGGIVNQLARFAVPYFFIVSGYFFYIKAFSNQNIDSYFISYGLKLAYVYIFWYLIYAFWPVISPGNWEAIKLNGIYFEIKNEANILIGEFTNHMLYYILAGGRAYHLWFIPALGCGISILYVSIRLNIFKVGFLFAVFLFIVALLLEPYNKSPLGLPIELGARNGPFFSSIFIFIGALLAQYNLNKIKKNVILLILFAGMLLQVIEVFVLREIYALKINEHDFVLSTIFYATGVALYALKLENFGKALRLDKLGGLTLGMYVCHVLVIYVLNAFELMPSSDVAAVLIVVLLSIVLTLFFSKIPVLKKLV